MDTDPLRNESTTTKPDFSERIVIGSILVRGRNALDEIRQRVSEGDLTNAACRLIFQSIMRLSKTDAFIGQDTVYADITRHGRIKELGPNPGAVISAIHDEAGVGCDLEYHAGIVADASMRRKLALIGDKLAVNARTSSGAVEDISAVAYSELLSLEGGSTASEPRTWAEITAEAIDDINERTKPGYVSDLRQTGMEALDKQSGGGFAPGELVILAARPGRGKTAMLLQWARGFADRAERPLLFSLEMRDKEQGARILAAEAKVNSRLFRGAANLDGELIERIHAAHRKIRSGPPAWIDDKSETTPERLLSVSRKHISRKGTRVVLVDYLQLMKPTNSKDNRNQQVGQACRELKLLARNQGVVVVCAAQLNREIDGRPDPTPRLSDLRDSGEIEQHADFVYFLHGAAVSQHKEIEDIELICGKGRSVSAGHCLKLKWNKPLMTFTETIPGIDL